MEMMPTRTPHRSVWVLAQVGPDTLGEWVQWGVLGVILVAIVVGQLVPGYLYKELKGERDQLQTENKELFDRLLLMQESVVPALTASTEAVSQANEELKRQVILRDYERASESNSS